MVRLAFTAKFILLAFLLGTLVGCGAGFNAMSGDDASRAGAIHLSINALHDDRLSRGVGDDTDWKSFEIFQQSSVRVRIWWDSYEDVSATLGIYDSRATLLSQLSHDDERAMDTTEALVLEPGKYFLRVELGGGESVYTLEVLTENSAGGSGASSRPGF